MRKFKEIICLIGARECIGHKTRLLEELSQSTPTVDGGNLAPLRFTEVL